MASSDLERIWRRVFGQVSRVKVGGHDASGKTQKITFGSQPTGNDDAEHVEPYGFTSRPLAGAEAVVLTTGASAEHPVAIVVGDRRYRLVPDTAGDVVLYDHRGSRIDLAERGIHARTDADVKLGRTVGGNYDPVMAYSVCNTDLEAIEAWGTSLVSLLNAALATIDANAALAKAATVPPEVAIGPSGYAPVVAPLVLAGGQRAINTVVEV